MRNIAKKPVVTSQPSPADQFFEELENLSSCWHEVKVAEMPGNDFVFMPSSLSQHITTLQSLSVCVKKVRALLGKFSRQTTLISFWEDEFQKIHFIKYEIEWQAGKIIKAKKQRLNNKPQNEFIGTVYQHSEPLICPNN